MNMITGSELGLIKRVPLPKLTCELVSYVSRWKVK